MKALGDFRGRRRSMLLAMPLDSAMSPLDHALMRIAPWLYALSPDRLRWFLLVMTAGIMVWAGRGIYLNAINALAPRHYQHEYAGEPRNRRGLRIVRVCYDLPAPGREVYFDAVLLIVGFLLLGKSLEGRAKRRALAALDSLARLRPDHRAAHSKWRSDHCAA